MNWTEIKVSVNNAYIETAAAIANMTVPYGIYIEDYSDLEQSAEEIAHINLIDEQLINKNRETAIIHIYISECDNAAESLEFLKERLLAAGIEHKAEAVGVDDSDWNENWKKYFHPFTVGKKLAVVPSWEDYQNTENRVILNIDPGAAFGTGTHATTSLCLTMLEKFVKSDDKILDIGCGSGILAIASVLLGGKEALGVDIDAQSVKTATENAQINNITDKTDFVVGDLADKVTQKYNIVCANIVADVVIRLLENVAQYMCDDAVLLVSGIIDERERDVLCAAEKFGFEIYEKQYKDNWCAFALKVKN